MAADPQPSDPQPGDATAPDPTKSGYGPMVLLLNDVDIDYEVWEDRQRGLRERVTQRQGAGRTVIHVLSDTNPGDGFQRASGGLEDVYLATVNASRRAA